MSGDPGRENGIVGTALARAVEMQTVRQTPFDRSRIAARLARPARSVLAPALASAAAIAVGLALGAALLGQRGAAPGPVATEPTRFVQATPGPTPSADPSPTPSPSPTLAPTHPRNELVFFPRDGLPPVGVRSEGAGRGATAEQRIASRLSYLNAAVFRGSLPPDAYNPFPPSDPALLKVARVALQGELATIDFSVPDGGWRVSGAARSQALLQQLVYTATEEPSIRRVLFTENGGPMVIDQLVVDRPLSREDVSGYAFSRPSERIDSQEQAVPASLDSSVSIDTFAPGLARLRLRLVPSGVQAGGWLPSFTAEIARNDQGASAGKWILRVFVPAGRDPRALAQNAPLEILDLSPLRDMRVVAEPNGTSYLLGLDDARPWRVSVRTQEPVQIFVDVGGDPRSVSDSVAVETPNPGTATSRDIGITGSARAFEANVQWRVRDSAERIVASGQVTATVGTSAVWGRFTTSAIVPANVSGDITLEVFSPSPRDGSPLGLVRIPLRLR